MNPRPVLVEARGLVKHFRPLGGWGRFRRDCVRAVDGVDLTIHERETLALVGESGSGKTTAGRLLIRLVEPDAGEVRFDGVNLLQLRPRELRRMRRHFQMVFQDPYSSLNPRMRVGAAIEEPLVVHRLGDRSWRRRRVAELLEQVGLAPADARKYPHEFSGGQRQRIGIARAIACSPRFLVADEPVSSLDPPIQAQIVNLLAELQEKLGLAYLFIAHDLRLVRHVSDRVAVMYLGRIVEEGPTGAIFREPLHPYTRALLAATPVPQPGQRERARLRGDPPSPVAPPPGCRFHPRCPLAEPVCAEVEPALLDAGEGRRVACHLVHRSAEAAGASG